MDIIVIKLGGSLITDKSKYYTIRPEVIIRLVSEIKEAHKQRPHIRFIIGNGSGSFGHNSAKKYGTMDGYNDEYSKFGFCYVQKDAAHLNSIIVDEFISQGICVIGFQGSTIMLSENKKCSFYDFTTLKQYLKKNIIPIVYGTPVLDTQIGSTIFSTDKVLQIIIKYLVENTGYNVEKMLSVGDYDGVLDSKGNVIELINRENFADIVKNYITKPTNVDVTGSMKAKIEELLDIAGFGVHSYILSGIKENNLKNAILGDDFIATTIKK